MTAFWHTFIILSTLMSSCALFLTIDVVKTLRSDLDHEISLRRELEHKLLRISDNTDKNTLKIIELKGEIARIEKENK